MWKLIVRRVAAEQIDELNSYVLVFYESADGSGERIEMQRGLYFDDQDRKLGQDTYCICLASGATHYGGIRACVLFGNLLTLRLSEEAAAELGIDQRILVELRVAPDAVGVVPEGLLRIFSDDRDRPEEFVVSLPPPSDG